MKMFRHRSDIRSVFFIVLAIAVYFMQWWGVVRHPLLFAASFALAFIACVINHNHQHHPTFTLQPFNSVFSTLISLAMGVPATVITAMHNDHHHVYNNGPIDHFRASAVSYRWSLLNLLVYPVVVFARLTPEKFRTVRKWRETAPRRHRQLMFERTVFYGTIVVLAVADWRATLLYFALPYIVAQWCLLAINHVQHVDCDPDSEFNHSRNVVGRWSNWWLFNNGYHTAHHMRPGLHWSRLPAEHAKIRSEIDSRLECRSLFFALIALYIRPATTTKADGAAG